MQPLGDFFSKNYKEEYAYRNISVGTVLKCFVRNTTPPKEKRFVVLGNDNSGKLVGAVFINSEINWRVIRTESLAELQHFVREEDNDYLSKDCYIDCSDLVEIPYDEINLNIQKNPDHVLGVVKDDDLVEIFKNVKKSPKISPKMLRRFNIK